MSWSQSLTKTDPVMRTLVRQYGAQVKLIRPVANPFRELVESIISQQLSVKAADTIMRRFCGLYRGPFPSPQRVRATPLGRMRSCGLSGSKAQYIHNVADAFIRGHLNRSHLLRMDDDQVRTTLIAIKGVGPWTAEMFLIFALGRPDVFSFGDVGLQNAIVRQYHRKATPPVMARLARAWAPYRSYAARLLWKSLRNT